MSPPLETHEKTGSIGVDNELSLLSSPKPINSTEQNDQAMDLFLNQVAEYNAHQQQLSFDQQPSSSISNIGKTINLTTFLFFLFLMKFLSSSSFIK
jgi:hypothetical protein